MIKVKTALKRSPLYTRTRVSWWIVMVLVFNKWSYPFIKTMTDLREGVQVTLSTFPFRHLFNSPETEIVKKNLINILDQKYICPVVL